MCVKSDLFIYFANVRLWDSHLLSAPDDVMDFVLVLQQLAQLSGPQSTKLHRQRHVDPPLWMRSASSRFGACLFPMRPAGAQCEHLMLRSKTITIYENDTTAWHERHKKKKKSDVCKASYFQCFIDRR